MRIEEKAREIPLVGEYDVIVAGGGVAGIAAALAAARHGAKTLLLERTYLLGGLATAGLVTVYLPLCDGEGHQVSFGLAEELLRLSVSRGFEPGGGTMPDRDGGAWLFRSDPEERKRERFQAEFNANLFALLAEKLLRETGVEILYGVTVADVLSGDGAIRALVTESKSGREAYRARSFVDATGDADLAYLAGEKTREFGQGNVLAAWFYEYLAPYYRLRMVGTADTPEKYRKPGETGTGTKRYRGLDAREISELTFASHESVLAHFLENGGIGRDHALATVATIPQLRMTRRLDGLYTLDDTEDKAYFEDSVGMISDWRKRGPVYEIPFRTLIGRKFRNLVVCGRIVSVTDAMWDISRVIPPCAVTGEAAGTAAAMTDDFHGLDIHVLQKKLMENGVRLHTGEVLAGSCEKE